MFLFKGSQAKASETATKDVPHNCVKDGITDQAWPFVQQPKPSIPPLFGERVLEVLERKDYTLPQSRIFCLQKFLTPFECDYYIKAAQKIGYSSLAQEFEAEYRNNKRVSMKCPELAEQLWKILAPQFVSADLEGVTPFGYGNRGEWRAVGLGSWFKFSEYHEHTYFKAHMDSTYVINSDVQSIYTLMIYLNDDFEGGATAFYARDDLNGTKDPLIVLTPVRGQAVVFNHDTRHAGLEVTKGVKYIMRTEVLFERVTEQFQLKPEKETQLEAKALFDHADKLELSGRFVDACSYHLKAMELQAQRGTFEWKEEREGVAENRVAWPLSKATNIQVCNYLSLREIFGVSRTCKRLLMLNRDGELWKQLYRRKWPNFYSMEANNAVNLQSWLPRFQRAYLLHRRSCPVLLDLGACYTKIAMIGSQKNEPQLSTNNRPLFSIVGLYYRAHYSIAGNGEDQAVRLGDEMDDSMTCSNIQYPNMSPNGRGLDGFLMRLFQHHRINVRNHPVLLALPMELSLDSDSGKKWINDRKLIFYRSLQVPSVGFVDGAVAALMDVGLKDGICVSVGYKHMAVVVVRNYQRVLSSVVPVKRPKLVRDDVFSDFMEPLREQDELESRTAVAHPSWEMFFKKCPELPQTLPTFVFHSLKSEHYPLLNSMVLTGGVTGALNFQERFRDEFAECLPANLKATFQLVARPENPCLAVLRGLSFIAVSGDFRTTFEVAEVRDPVTGATALLSACYQNNLPEVKRLLEANSDPEIREATYNQTALMIAASRGHLQVCKVLLANGANVGAKDRDGMTPYQIAEYKGHIKVMALIKQHM